MQQEKESLQKRMQAENRSDEKLLIDLEGPTVANIKVANSIGRGILLQETSMLSRSHQPEESK